MSGVALQAGSTCGTFGPRVAGWSPVRAGADLAAELPGRLSAQVSSVDVSTLRGCRSCPLISSRSSTAGQRPSSRETPPS